MWASFFLVKLQKCSRVIGEELLYLPLKNMKRAIIGLGSNIGDRAEYLRQAREQVEHCVGRVECVSSVIETEPWGFDAPPFLNQVIIVLTELAPLELLDVLQQIERQLGRTQKSEVVDGRTVYHNRTIDLDILDYDGLCYCDERLVLPHPRIQEREFVLRSLKELNITINPAEESIWYHIITLSLKAV